MTRDSSPGRGDDEARDARIVVLLSGTGSNFAALAEAAVPGGRIVAAVSDRADAGGLEFARADGIATAVVSPRDFIDGAGALDRPAWDAALAKAVRLFAPDLVVSAGFMRILGPAFLEGFGGRTINTHPALLPSFPGAHAVRDALAAGVATTGVTVHFVDDGVDTGPILVQESVQVREGDDVESLHERIKTVERVLLVRTVARLVAEGWSVFESPKGLAAAFGRLPEATYYPPQNPGGRPSRSRTARPHP